jgi:hypothetical protein
VHYSLGSPHQTVRSPVSCVVQRFGSSWNPKAYLSGWNFCASDSTVLSSPSSRSPGDASRSRRRCYELEWALPLEPDLETHVILYDLERHKPDAFAVGHGADEAEALLNLRTTLTPRSEWPEAAERSLVRSRAVPASQPTMVGMRAYLTQRRHADQGPGGGCFA